MIAAPFLGEFGWEVSLWVPWLRFQRLHPWKARDMTVLCRPGHEHLYEDFATKVQAFAYSTPSKVDCQNVWVDGSLLRKPDYLTMTAVAMRTRLMKRDLITPSDLQVHWSGDSPPILKHSEYRVYGHPGEKVRGWLAVHTRLTNNNSERNWPVHKWAELLESLDPEHLIIVGSLDGSGPLPVGEDLRGQPLKEVCDAISRCQLMVGPSSGPLALAMLCGTAVAWWSPNLKDEPRFRTAWNPFNVEETQVAKTWDPDPDEVEEVCQRYL